MAAVVLVMSTGSDKAKIINVYDPSAFLQMNLNLGDNQPSSSAMSQWMPKRLCTKKRKSTASNFPH
ncbi:MAG: hypothetical protein IPN46_12690 [Saprospiraceae bacterium]|nr:hypothetical protein [Saprospiraceae bacterium]